MIKHTILTLSLLVGLLYAPQAQVMMIGPADSLSFITSPLDVDSLFYWFAADVGVTTNNNKVTQWNDLSGNGYNVTQADTSKAPSFEATGGPGSKPTIEFDGTNDFLASASHFWGSDDLTVFMVMKFGNATRDEREFPIGRSTSAGNLRQWVFGALNTANDYNHYYVVNSAGTGAPNEALVRRSTTSAKSTSYSTITYTHTGTTSDNLIHVDGSSQSLSDTFVTPNSVFSGTGAIVNSTQKTGIGCLNADGTPSNFLQGSISEIIVFSRALTATERLAMELYLNRKYDLY